MMRNSGFSGVVAVLLMQVAMTCPATGNVVVELHCAKQVRVGDPLFVKVCVLNEGDVDERFDEPPSVVLGTVAIEVRALGDENAPFERVTGPGEHGEIPPFTLSPASVYCTYAVIFAHDGDLTLKEAGRYEIRARARQTERESQYSDIVVVNVLPVSPPMREKLNKIRLELSHVLRLDGIAAHVSRHRVKELAAELSGSAVGETLEFVATLLSVRQEDDPTAGMRAQSLRDLDRGTKNAVEIEIMTLMLATELARVQEWQMVRDELRQVEQPSLERDRLLLEAEYRLEEK